MAETADNHQEKQMQALPRGRDPVSKAPNREDMAIASYMAVSTTATQQALRGKQKQEMLWGHYVRL